MEKYISGPVVCSAQVRRERAGETNNSSEVGRDFRISGQPEAMGVTCDSTELKFIRPSSNTLCNE